MTREVLKPQIAPRRGPRPHPAVPTAAAAGRSTPANARVPRWAWGLPALSILLQSIIFLGMDPAAPAWLDWGLLSFVCLTPWLWLAAQPVGLRAILLVSYGSGVAFYFINTHYLWALTGPGYLALAVSFGLHYALFGAGVWALYRRAGLPMTAAAPVVWVTTEFLRSLGPTSLPLLFLSHGLYRKLAFIQISDLTGALGVSFVAAMINGLAADLLLSARPGTGRARGLYPCVAVALLVTAATVLYGIVRLGSPDAARGPQVAVIQGDYPLTVDGPGAGAMEKRDRYLELALLALQEQPDLLVLPETPWTMVLNDEFLAASQVRSEFEQRLQEWSLECDGLLQLLSAQHGAYLVVGAGSLEYFPDQDYPKYRKYNSAFVYAPDGSPKRRYDKVALVMFGEYTPLRGGRLHRLYELLDGLNPFSTPEDEFSLTHGRELATFDMTSADGRASRFAVPICFEDLIPAIGRAFSVSPGGRKRADFLLSISNDGWFNHSAAVPQHLAVCAFRAVENRVGIARSVNSSCSGFIDPCGRMHDFVQRDGRVLGREIFGYSVAQVRTDPRVTFYSRRGDWLGLLCTMIAAVGVPAALLRGK